MYMEASMKLEAAQRLLASEDWWEAMPADQKKQYIKDHPNSKYAKDAIKDADKAEEAPAKEEPTGDTKDSKETKVAASTLRKNGSKIAQKLKSSFPRMRHATSGLKSLATGKPLEDEQKEALVELGTLALNTGLSKSFGVWHALTISQVGLTAVKHAMDHYKEKKAAAPDKDDTEVFVDAVADGLEQPVKPVSKAEFKSFYKGTIANHLKGKAKHIVKVIDKSFSDVKPALQGLNAVRKGQKMDAEHKEALISLSKFAIGTAITYLPGGVFAHLGASVGVVAVNHAVKVIRKRKSEEPLLNQFVEAVVDSLEDSLLDAAAG
jgi:hypothetical protein